MKIEEFQIQEFCAWLVEQVSERTAQKVVERIGQGEEPGDEALTVVEAADFLRLGQSTVYKMAADGRLPSVKLGGRLVFRRADLSDYLEAHRRGDEVVGSLAKAARKGE